MKKTLVDVIEESFPDAIVQTVSSGQDAIAEIQKNNGNFTYVLLDYLIHGKDGFETFKSVHESYPKVPVGLCTRFHGTKLTINDVAEIYGFTGCVDIDGNDQYKENLNKLILEAMKIRKRHDFDREYKVGLETGKYPIKDLVLIDTVVGGDAIARPFGSGYDITTLVKAFTDEKKVIGAFVDAEEWMVDKAIEEADKAAEYWSDDTKISKDVFLMIMERMGRLLYENRVSIGGKAIDLDDVICQSNQAAYDIVSNDRRTAGLFASRTDEYEEWALRHLTKELKLEDYVKTVTAFVQSSMYQTGAYGIIESLRARKSIIVKLDSKDPYPQYQVGMAFIQAWKELQEQGVIDKKYKPPLQILAWDTRSHLERGSKLISKTDATIYMGNPKHAILAEYRTVLNNHRPKSDEDLIELSNIFRQKKSSSHVLYFTANKAGAYLSGIKSLESLESYIDQIVDSARSHYRSCKRLLTFSIGDWHPDAPDELKARDFYETAFGILKQKMFSLKIGHPGDREAEVVIPSPGYMKEVNRYLSSSAKFGKVHRDNELGPAIVELPKYFLLQSDLELMRHLGDECMFPVLNVFRGDEDIAKRVLYAMNVKNQDEKILEYTIWTDDPEIFDRFVDRSSAEKYSGQKDIMHTQEFSHGLHLNEPTTNGLGTFREDGSWKMRGHEGYSLYLKLRTMGANGNKPCQN
ncbi:response regulator [Candidatus Woesearchaeota archaeon]|nr:response regulator [Candidatus Woesearchaeota archaeon]